MSDDKNIKNTKENSNAKQAKQTKPPLPKERDLRERYYEVFSRDVPCNNNKNNK